MKDPLVTALKERRDDEARARAAAARFAKVAGALADVAYAHADSPFGPLFVATTKRGLVRVGFPEDEDDGAVAELARWVSPRILESPARLDEVRRQLEEYFDGKRTRFEMPVDLSPAKGFTRKVLAATARIPFGSVSTYRDVARRAGSPAAVRAAGNALGWNRVPIVVPCHRVVRTGGNLGGYGGGLDRKAFLLRLEGALTEA
jgi:methylated-DNA-[protein]-cysteine S-methyltransferase